MKKLSMVAMVVCVLVLALTMVPSAASALDVSIARIVKVGYNAAMEGATVQLEDMRANPAWTGVRQFYLSAGLGNRGLATLLTAYSLQKTVWVRIEDPGDPGSLISVIYIND